MYNFVRGLSPYPTAWTSIDQLKVKVFLTTKEVMEHDYAPGRIITDNKKSLKIAAKGGFLNIVELQLQSRKRMSTAALLNGYTIESDCVEIREL